MKRTLIAYYSLGGNTAKVAMDVAARLGADVLQIREITPRRGVLGYIRAALDSVRERSSMLEYLHKSSGDYQLTIVGTPVWAGRMTPAVRTYLKIFRGGAGRIAFFTTSGSTDVAKLLPEMQRLAGREAIASAGFTEHDLRDAATYTAKLDAFISALHPAPSVASLAEEHALEHAPA